MSYWSLRARRSVDFFEKYAVWFVFGASLIASVVATYYYFRHGDILAYNDARSHIDIARRVIDSKTPGIVQVGTVWLPLPPLLTLPFVANYTLWHNGLAGSIVSMISYVVATVFIFKISRLLTANVYAGLLGALIFMLNPNIIYMQSTPMTELCLIATMLFGSYFFIKWLYRRRMLDLVVSAFGIFLSTLVRYEGWFVLLTCTVIILCDGLIFTKERAATEGRAILFVTLGSLGIFIWVLWNLAIWGNPLYFLNGNVSALAQQNQLAALGELPTKHNLLLSISTTLKMVYLNIGALMAIAGTISLLVVALKKFRDRKIMFALAVLLAPIVLDLITLFAGVTVVNTSWSQMFNIRYGVMALPFVAVVVAVAVAAIKLPKWAKVGLGACIVAVGLTAITVTLYDPIHGIYGSGLSPQTRQLMSAFLADYKGGSILASTYAFDPAMQMMGIPLKNYISEGNYHIWQNALVRPQDAAQYVLMAKGGSDVTANDLVYKDYLARKSLFDKYYRVAYAESGYELLIRKSSSTRQPA